MRKKYEEKKWNVTGKVWHMTGDMWHMTHGVGSEGKEWPTQSINEWASDKCVCRTNPVLVIMNIFWQHLNTLI